LNWSGSLAADHKLHAAHRSIQPGRGQRRFVFSTTSHLGADCTFERAAQSNAECRTRYAWVAYRHRVNRLFERAIHLAWQT
jgi:hypothetical protein